MDEKQLDTAEEEKDLEIIITKDFSVIILKTCKQFI